MTARCKKENIIKLTSQALKYSFGPTFTEGERGRERARERASEQRETKRVLLSNHLMTQCQEA